MIFAFFVIFLFLLAVVVAVNVSHLCRGCGNDICITARIATDITHSVPTHSVADITHADVTLLTHNMYWAR